MWVWILSLFLLIAPSNLSVEMPVKKILKPPLGIAMSGRHRSHTRYRGVVAHWLIGEGGGLKVRDVSGVGNDGTLDGLPSIWTIGQFGYVLNFNGTSDNVQSDTTGPLGSQNRTINLWILHAAEVTASETLVFWGDVNGTADNGERYEFRIDETGADVLRTEVQGGFNRGTSQIVDDGNWHMVTSVLDGSNATDIVHYMDGVLDASSSSGSQAINTSADSVIHIGCNDSNVGLGRFNSGRFDDVRIYNRALNAREVWSLYTDPFLEFRPSRQAWKAPAAVGPTVPDQTLAPTSQMTNSGGMVGNINMKRHDRIYVPEELQE